MNWLQRYFMRPDLSTSVFHDELMFNEALVRKLKEIKNGKSNQF